MPVAADPAGRARAGGKNDSPGPVRRPPEEQVAWRAYRLELHRFVRARVEDEAAAEDLVHDVLLRAYSQRDTLRDAGQLRPWLYRITRNALIRPLSEAQAHVGAS